MVPSINEILHDAVVEPFFALIKLYAMFFLWIVAMKVIDDVYDIQWPIPNYPNTGNNIVPGAFEETESKDEEARAIAIDNFLQDLRVAQANPPTLGATNLKTTLKRAIEAFDGPDNSDLFAAADMLDAERAKPVRVILEDETDVRGYVFNGAGGSQWLATAAMIDAEFVLMGPAVPRAEMEEESDDGE